MKYHYWIVLILIFSLGACSDQDEIDKINEEDPLPSCIQTLIDQEESMFLKIRTQVIDDEIHYWINTGANAYDGDELIVDKDCNEKCRYKGWVPADCIEAYDHEVWEIIWEK